MCTSSPDAILMLSGSQLNVTYDLMLNGGYYNTRYGDGDLFRGLILLTAALLKSGPELMDAM